MRVEYQGILDAITDACDAAELAGRKIEKIFLTRSELSLLSEELGDLGEMLLFGGPILDSPLHLGMINEVNIWREEG